MFQVIHYYTLIPNIFQVIHYYTLIPNIFQVIYYYTLIPNIFQVIHYYTLIPNIFQVIHYYTLIPNIFQVIHYYTLIPNIFQVIHYYTLIPNIFQVIYYYTLIPNIFQVIHYYTLIPNIFQVIHYYTLIPNIFQVIHYYTLIPNIFQVIHYYTLIPNIFQVIHYYTLIPNIFQKLQEMEERRIERVGVSMKTYAEVDREVLPIVGKCLDGMTKAAESIEPKTDSKQVVESYKSGFEPPGDVEFEDYGAGQSMKRTVSETSLSNSRGEAKERPSGGKSKGKLWPFIKNKNKLMSLLTSPHQPPPAPPASSPPSPSAVPNDPQSPKQNKEPLSNRFNEFMASKPKMTCLRSLRRGQPPTRPLSLCYHKDWRTQGIPTYAFEARQYVLSLKLITLNSHVRNLIEGSGPEDFSHLPPEQRRKKLQAKIDDLNKDIQKEMDQKDALTKMKGVYEKNPQMGDPASVDPRLVEIAMNIEKLQYEVQKFEGWLAEVEGRLPSKSDPPRRQSGLYETQNSNSSTVANNCAQDRESSPDGSYTEEQSSETQDKVAIANTPEFDDEFDDGDEETLPTIGTCKAIYQFEGHNEGTISVTEGELLYVIEEDKGDGWTRVRRNEEEEGYVPTSYVEVSLETTAKGAMTYI
ncbi:formin-binding protein 1-like isoform X17 [Salvelinus fontinalis]|uniref:formin-binding protein 1-like isoform X17 n=1 Tax=Salvelinus fontinalis TaxID=8038 RepID=UPI002485DA8F|nr:formin-binding protein 1-like isoform X17 [Salvelinus fontinalis]